MRAALTTRSKAACDVVLSWQYVNCLRAWTLVLCKYATDASRPLFNLVFPLVQLLTGLVRLSPTAKYFPLRLHAVAMLVELTWATGLYIPLFPMLTEVLASPVVLRKPAAMAAADPPRLPLVS